MNNNSNLIVITQQDIDNAPKELAVYFWQDLNFWFLLGVVLGVLVLLFFGGIFIFHSVRARK